MKQFAPFLTWGWIVFLLLASIANRTANGKPLVPRVPPDAVWSEKWTSGRSGKNLFTRTADVNGCLLVAVTPDALVVSACFPFSLFFLPELFDLEHRIPHPAIRSVTPKKRLFKESVAIEFDDGSGRPRSIELVLRGTPQFLTAIGRAQLTR